MTPSLHPKSELGSAWSYAEFDFFGLSLSGIRTCIALPAFQFCFDVAQGFPFSLNLKKYFISHGHLDHAAGIPYIISQKAMNSQAPADFWMPKSLLEPMTEILRLWEKIEGHQYQFHFHEMNLDTEVEINARYTMKSFSTVHRIDSCGYTLFEKKKKLKPDFQNLPGARLAELRKTGTELNDVSEIPQISFTGDTQIEFLLQNDWVRKSRILITECTYLDNKKTIEQAKKWGHLHLDELIAHLDQIESEKIVLIHLSSRYSTEYAQQLLQKKIPKKHLDRIEIFPGR